jgi:CRP-like cAMP-binding protein
MLIGELALFVETQRPATAIAERRTEVVEITRTLMTRMLEEYPRLALHFRARLASRLSANVADMEKVRQALLVDGPAPRKD